MGAAGVSCDAGFAEYADLVAAVDAHEAWRRLVPQCRLEGYWE